MFEYQNSEKLYSMSIKNSTLDKSILKSKIIFGHMVCFGQYSNISESVPYSTITEFEQFLINTNSIYIPIFKYERDKLAISHEPNFPCESELSTMLIGYMFASIEEIKKWFGVKKITPHIAEKTKNLLIDEVDYICKYLLNMIFDYSIYDKYGKLVDSGSQYTFSKQISPIGKVLLARNDEISQELLVDLFTNMKKDANIDYGYLFDEQILKVAEYSTYKRY